MRSDLGQVEEEVAVRRAPARAAAPAARMSIALWRGFGLVLRRADLDAQRAAGAVLGRDLDRVLHALELGRLVRRCDLNVAGALVERARRRRPSRGSRRAGRPARTCCTGCRAPDPRPGSRARCCASPTCAVPVGQVPSTGNALTGSRSPLPAIITAVTCCTKSGACVGDDRRPRCASTVAVAGTGTSCRCASVASTAAKFCCTTSSPCLP